MEVLTIELVTKASTLDCLRLFRNAPPISHTGPNEPNASALAMSNFIRYPRCLLMAMCTVTQTILFGGGAASY